MKHLKKLKLNQIIKSEVKKNALKRILGGACTDYSCDCSNPGLNSCTVDATLDTRSECGYLP
jgi:natural product precursor